MASNIIKCSGLQTFGNEISRPTGSLRKAINVNVDEDGVITPRRGFNDYQNPTNDLESEVTGFVSQIMEYKDALIRQYGSSLEYEDTAGVFQPVTGDFNPLLTGFRTKWQEANSNLYFTSDEGIKKISKNSQANFSADMVSNSGGLKASYASGKIVPTVGGFLPPSSKVAYRVLYGTKDANNNLIYGSPSARFIVTNFSTDVETYEVSSIVFDTTVTTDEITNGDYFVYQNTNSKYTIYYDTDGTATEPKTAETIGSIYVKVEIPAADVDNNAVIAAITANTLAAQLDSTEVTLDGTDTVLLTTTDTGDLTEITDAVDSAGDSISDGTGGVRLTTSVSVQGATTSGTSSTVSITGVIPNDASTEYFYQVYRSGTLSTSVGLTLDDIDPGDELNIVYEAGLTQAQIDAGEFVFTDTTPESFRAEGAPLYTNAVTGEGILQANEAPPIALDIELFRNYMFYANTKQRHKLEFTVISVDDFVTGATKITIGNSDIARFYTFVGVAEVTDVTIDAVPNAGDYINLYSANDDRQYYVYFGGTGDNPNVAGAVGYRVAVAGLTTVSEVALAIEEALLDNVDFSLSVALGVITFTHTNNGYTTGITNGVGSDITISAPSTDGVGELKYDATTKPEGGDVLLSGLVSVGQSIDQTARSLVKIISQDPLSPVNAYYLSTGEDLPGNILLEARSLEDNTFYIAIEDSNDAIGEEFTPEIPYASEIESITGNGGTTNIELTAHGYITGDDIIVSYLKEEGTDYDGTIVYNPGELVEFSGSTYINILVTTGINDASEDPSGDTSNNTYWEFVPVSFSGLYEVTYVDDDNFTIEIATPSSVISFDPSFSAIYTADVESDNEELTNRIYYSKKSEPEAVPTINYVDVGTRDGQIRRILALRDELYVLKDDGVYVLSGTTAPDFSVRLIDNTKIIAPDSAVVLNNQIYCLTEQGIVRISGSAVAVISRGIENLIDNITNKGFDYSPNTFGIPYENDRAFIMFLPKEASDSTATQAFRYNIFEQTWTRWEYEATCGHVLSTNNKLYLGNGNRNYISEERKDDLRTDHSDRNFTRTISTNGVSDDQITLSSIVDVKVNDVVVQQQDVTINFINNRILRKMDLFDSGTTLGESGGVITYSVAQDIATFTTPYNHNLESEEEWEIRITDSDSVTTTEIYEVTVTSDTEFTIEYDSSGGDITEAIFRDYFLRVFSVVAGDNLADKIELINDHLVELDTNSAAPGYITAKTFTASNLLEKTQLLIDELNLASSVTSIKTYKSPTTVYFESYITEIDILRNLVTVETSRPFVEGEIEVYKGFTRTVEWNPLHFGDPSALKHISFITIMFDQNNFNDAEAKFSSDASQGLNIVPFKGKGIGYWGDLPWGAPNAYWGGTGNDIPFRNPVPRSKSKCRYLSVSFEHKNAREEFRIIGVSGEVRLVSNKAYRNIG